MLSIFPTLLAYEQLAPFIIRIALGAVLIYWRIKASKETATIANKTVRTLEGVSGILLIIGLYTQVASLFVVIDMIVRIVDKIKHRQFLTDGVNYYALLLVMALSLVFLGAGAFSFDLPL